MFHSVIDIHDEERCSDCPGAGPYKCLSSKGKVHLILLSRNELVSSGLSSGLVH